MYYFLYNTTTGQIVSQNQSGYTPGTDEEVLTASETNSDAIIAYQFSERYLIQGTPAALVEQPYFTLAATASGNEWTLTATLNNAPATPPTEATFSLAGGTETATITNGVATLTIDLHASVATAPINVTAGASGCATSRPTSIGGSTPVPVALQVYTPNGGNLTVAPTGAGSKTFLEAFYALAQGSVQRYLADIGTAISLLTDAVFNILVPASTATLSADQQNALADVKANVLPNLYTTLANAYPANGTKQLQYADYAADLAVTFKAFENYTADLAEIPNLA